MSIKMVYVHLHNYASCLFLVLPPTAYFLTPRVNTDQPTKEPTSNSEDLLDASCGKVLSIPNGTNEAQLETTRYNGPGKSPGGPVYPCKVADPGSGSVSVRGHPNSGDATCHLGRVGLCARGAVDTGQHPPFGRPRSRTLASGCWCQPRAHSLFREGWCCGLPGAIRVKAAVGNQRIGVGYGIGAVVWGRSMGYHHDMGKSPDTHAYANLEKPTDQTSKPEESYEIVSTGKYLLPNPHCGEDHAGHCLNELVSAQPERDVTMSHDGDQTCCIYVPPIFLKTHGRFGGKTRGLHKLGPSIAHGIITNFYGNPGSKYFLQTCIGAGPGTEESHFPTKQIEVERCHVSSQPRRTATTTKRLNNNYG